MLIFKKLFSQFFFPVPVVIFVCLAGLYVLWFTKKQKTGKVFVSIGIFLFVMLGYGIGSNMAVSYLENQFPAYDNNDSIKKFKASQGMGEKFVVVLAGGHISNPDIPITSQLSNQSLVRLIEGIRIYRDIPGSKLVISGGKGGFDFVPNAIVMEAVARSIGVDVNDMILETKSNDTKDEAIYLKYLLMDKPFILVTSASHMPRSIAMFRKLGMEPVPAPAGHIVKGSNNEKINPVSFFPGGDAITRWEAAFYEYMGLAWAKVRGLI